MSKKIRIAINGFGRIGRAALKVAMEKDDVAVVAINDLAATKTLAHLLSYDTVYGRYERPVSATADTLVIENEQIPVFAIPDPQNIPWRDYDVDVVLECTGRFVKGDAARAHVRAGARRVILSAPPKNETGMPTYLIGVNADRYAGNEDVISNASCTTNCIAPVAAVMHEKFGVLKAMMTTIHSYTSDQRLQDAPHGDLRRARAAAHNIVPTTAGAALATAHVVPGLRDRFDGLSIRVPTIVVSLSDFTFLLKKDVRVEDVNAALTAATTSPSYEGVLGVTDEPLVSSDFIKDPRSGIVDLSLTRVVDGNMVKVIAWYDNEWGYANRLVELAQRVGSFL